MEPAPRRAPSTETRRPTMPQHLARSRRQEPAVLRRRVLASAETLAILTVERLTDEHQ